MAPSFKRSPRTFFKRAVSRKKSTNEKNGKGRGDKRGPKEGEINKPQNDLVQRETSTMDGLSPTTVPAKLECKDQFEETRAVEPVLLEKKTNSPIHVVKIKGAPAEDRSPKATQREQKENNCRENSSRARRGRGEGDRRAVPRTKDKNAMTTATRANSNGRAGSGEKTRQDGATTELADKNSTSNARRRNLKGKEQRNSSKVRGGRRDDFRETGYDTDGKSKEDSSRENPVASEDAATAFLLSAIQALKDMGESQSQSSHSGRNKTSSDHDNGGDSNFSAEKYRHLMEAFESYQSARNHETPGHPGSNYQEDDLSQIFDRMMRRSHLLEPVQRAISVGGAQGKRATESRSKSQAKQNFLKGGRSSHEAKGQMTQHSQSKVHGNTATTSIRRDHSLSQRDEGRRSEFGMKTRPSQEESRKRPSRLPTDYDHDDGDDNATVVTFQTEGEYSVEVSCIPDDESTVVRLFSGDKYGLQRNEHDSSNRRRQDGDVHASRGGKLQMELHSAWRDKGMIHNGMESDGGPVSLKTVRFDHDGPEVAWDLDFFPTEKMRDAEMKKREEHKQKEEEEHRRRMELWEASVDEEGEALKQLHHPPLGRRGRGDAVPSPPRPSAIMSVESSEGESRKLLRRPPMGRRGRGNAISHPPRPSAIMSVESSMGSSFAASEGVHSNAASSITCSIHSGRETSSSYASSAFTDDDTEPSLDFKMNRDTSQHLSSSRRNTKDQEQAT